MRPNRALKFGSLVHWAKEGNLELYERIKPSLSSSREVFKDDRKYESIEINTPFLVPAEGASYNEGQQVFKQVSEAFVSEPELKGLAVKSKYGSGKSTFLRQLMESQQYKRVLFITYRQTLARDIMRNFEALGFANYLDAYEKPRTWDSERLIVQYDSLMKVMTNNTKYMITDEFNAKYDLIILDECESLLMHIDGETMKRKEIETFEFFDQLLKLSGKIIGLDGDMSNRSLSFISSFGKFKYIVNKNQENNKSLRIIHEKDKWEGQLFEDIEAFRAEDPDFKVCVCSQSAKLAENLKNDLEEKYPELKNEAHGLGCWDD
jgi:hypothetical protein